MPIYDFRCDSCGQRFSLRYKSYAAYDRAQPRCAECGSVDLTRVISRVSIAKAGRDYAGMSANEMLSVLEGGDKRQVDALYRQVGASAAPTKPTVMPKQPSQQQESNKAGKPPDSQDT